MAKSNRTNPIAEHRSCLKSLEDTGVLSKEVVGIHNIICAKTGRIDSVGYDIQYRCALGNHPLLNKYRANTSFDSLWVDYAGGRALLMVVFMLKYRNNDNTSLAIRADFPENLAAIAMIQQSGSNFFEFHEKDQIRGDAYLITDRRRHWLLSNRKLARDLNPILSTPHTLLEGEVAHSGKIFFHEEPNIEDLTYLKLMTGI